MPSPFAPTLGDGSRPCMVGGIARVFNGAGACPDICDDEPPVPRSCCRGCPEQGWEIPAAGPVLSIARMDIDYRFENLGGRPDYFEPTPLVWQGSATSSNQVGANCTAFHNPIRLEREFPAGTGRTARFDAAFGVENRQGFLNMPTIEPGRCVGNYTGTPATNLYNFRFGFHSDPIGNAAIGGNGAGFYTPGVIERGGGFFQGGGLEVAYIPCSGLWAVSLGPLTVAERIADYAGGMSASAFSGSLSASVAPVIAGGSQIGMTATIELQASYVGPASAAWDGWSAREIGTVSIYDERFGNCAPAALTDCGCGCGGGCS